MNVDKPTKKTAAYWAERALSDLVILHNKSALVDAECHLEWALKDVKALIAERAERVQK